MTTIQLPPSDLLARGAAPRESGARERRFLRSTWVFSAILALALLVGNLIAQHSFLAPHYWPSLLATLAPFVLVAFASTVPILSGGGGIDISVGPQATLTNCLLAAVLFPHGLGSPWISIPLLLLIGAGVGLLNGALVVFGRLQPVIVTLATFFVLSGFALRVSPEPGRSRERELDPIARRQCRLYPRRLAHHRRRRSGVVRSEAHRTAPHAYAVGGDDVAAFSAGVNVNMVRISAYVASAVIATVAGIALTGRDPDLPAPLATTYSLVALAAVSLGGTSLMGGRGGLLGSFFGAVAIYLLQDLLAATGVSHELRPAGLRDPPHRRSRALGADLADESELMT